MTTAIAKATTCPSIIGLNDKINDRTSLEPREATICRVVSTSSSSTDLVGWLCSSGAADAGFGI
jgi:hypothetical protein